YIIEQLDSLFKQIDIEFSLYCSDDSSTDKSYQIIKMYESKVANIICCKNSGNPGPASNFLNALRLTSDEDYVIFCDQDDVWLSNKISSLVVFAIDKLKPDVPGLAYCDAFIVNEDLKTSKIKMYGDKHIAPKDIDELLYLNGGVQGASMIINKPMIIEMLSYNKYIYMHDQ
ncbi:glycosyltransferase, partial [Citrobacter portucalensis]|uniref:glycosyltransferase n=1 Tax=Citrobacter portucalensis TaxID=1639133 RepID=UPI00226AF258